MAWLYIPVYSCAYSRVSQRYWSSQAAKLPLGTPWSPRPRPAFIWLYRFADGVPLPTIACSSSACTGAFPFSILVKSWRALLRKGGSPVAYCASSRQSVDWQFVAFVPSNQLTNGSGANGFATTGGFGAPGGTVCASVKLVS